MSLKAIYCFVILFIVTKCSCNSITDYYVNLITEETARAFTYTLPQDASAHKPTSNYSSVYGTYDYIIVGAGSAGAVIANRLSEVKYHKILLLEAGGEDTNFTDIPRMHALLQGLEFNWNFNSTPQLNSCLGLFNKVCPYPRGKVLGGSSSINALMYVRGNKRDYDNWYQQGNPGWAYEDVLRLFKKSENSSINGDDGYHGTSGYFNVEYHKPNSRQYDAFMEANVELGRKVVDYNGKEQLGVAQTQLNVKNGKRESTAKAFLIPAEKRTNLKILMNSFVVKLLIGPLSKKAYGVLFTHNGKLFIAKARKEVIVCAGSIGSPQLLMLSGIGPKSHLEHLGIPVIQPLAVGDNFHDHPAYFTFHVVTNYTEQQQSLEHNVEQFLNAVGLLTVAGNPQGICFLQTNMATVPGYPDIEIIMSPSTHSTNFIQKTARYNDESYEALYSNINSSATFNMVLILLHPKSRGSVKLQSKSPYDYPLIDSAYFSDHSGEDIETLYQGIQLGLELLNTTAFKKLNATLRYAPLPACEKHEYLSREYWYCQIRQVGHSISHPVGTCKMGPDPSAGAVVNHELKVHGILNLRVADASIIPEITSGHTNAATIMIGEKAAELLLNQT